MLTFHQLEEYYLLKRKSKLRENVYIHEVQLLKHMTDILGDIKVPRLTISQYQKTLYELDHKTRNGKPYTTKYKNRIINTFKALCKFGERRFNLVTTVPDRFDYFKVKDSEINQEMKYITHDEFKQFIQVVDDPGYRSLFTVLFYMGLRIGEANALRWHDIDFANNTLSVNKTLTTKRRRDDGSYIENPPKTSTSNHLLPMPKIVSKELSVLHDYLSRIEHIRQSGSYSAVECRFLINNLGSDNILLISRYLGHKDVAMTLNRYSHLYRSKLIDLVEGIDKLEAESEG